MPKLIGPLFSLTASKSLAGLITYRTHRRNQIAQALRPRQKVRTQRQSIQRNKFAVARNSFKLLAPADIQKWRMLANAQRLQPFNLYFREYVAQNVIAGNQPLIPANRGSI